MSDHIDWRNPPYIDIVKNVNDAIDHGDVDKVCSMIMTNRRVFACPYHRDTDRYQITLLDEKLFDAARAGNRGLAVAITQLGGEINRSKYRGQGEGVAYRLAGIGADKHADMIEWLISERGALFQHMRNGEPVSDTLLSATITGSLRVVRFLVERGAPINGRSQNGLTALDFANQEGRPEIAEYLRSKGALTSAEVRAQQTEKK